MKENASDECENESYENVIDAHVFGGSVVDPWWILGGSGSFLVDPVILLYVFASSVGDPPSPSSPFIILKG